MTIRTKSAPLLAPYQSQALILFPSNPGGTPTLSFFKVTDPTALTLGLGLGLSTSAPQNEAGGRHPGPCSFPSSPTRPEACSGPSLQARSKVHSSRPEARLQTQSAVGRPIINCIPHASEVPAGRRGSEVRRRGLSRTPYPAPCTPRLQALHAPGAAHWRGRAHQAQSLSAPPPRPLAKPRPALARSANDARGRRAGPPGVVRASPRHWLFRKPRP